MPVIDEVKPKTVKTSAVAPKKDVPKKKTKVGTMTDVDAAIVKAEKPEKAVVEKAVKPAVEKNKAKAKKASPEKAVAVAKPTTKETVAFPAPVIREVLYPELEAAIFQGAEPLDVASAKKLLGWQAPEGEEKFKEYNFLDIHNRTILCNNLMMQRPYYKQTAFDLMQDILEGHWQNNLESIIVGKTGMVLDGKHRLIALVLAGQEYARNPENYPFWEAEPSIEVLVAFGAKEEAQVVNTIGTGKYRSLADSLYASDVLSAGLDSRNKKQHAKITEFAIRMLWARTGAMENAYSPRIRHSEALDFLQRHETIHQCVRTICDENGGKERKLDRILPLGACAGLLYLMGAGTDDDGDLYRKSDLPSEGLIKFTNMEAAEEFWLAIANSDDSVKAIRVAIMKLLADGNGTLEERVAVVIKGWNAYYSRSKVVAKDVHLKIQVDENGYRQLVEVPVIAGSIDHPME